MIELGSFCRNMVLLFAAGLIMAVPSLGQATRPKIGLDCTGARYAGAYCSSLEVFLNEDPKYALTSDGALNVQDGIVQVLVRPWASASLLTESLTLDSAVNNESHAYTAALIAWESSRLDQQSSGIPSSAGSTTLVSKPGASGLLSLAMESGGFTSSVNGTSMTLVGNLWNIDHLIQNGNLFEQQICSSNCENPLRNASVAATFTLDQSDSLSATTAGPGNSATQNISTIVLPTSSARMSSISARWNFWNSLDPASNKFQTAWLNAFQQQQAAVQQQGTALAQATGKLINASKMNDPTNAAFKALNEEMDRTMLADYSAHDGKRLLHDYESLLERYFVQARNNAPGQFDTLVTTAAFTLVNFEQLNEEIISTARGVPIITAEYTFNRPANQPYTHDFRLIVAESWKTGGQLSANLAGSVYQSIPAGAAYGRMKDVQLSAEFDQAMGDKTAPPVLLSLAGYGQYQFDPSVLNITSANLAPGTNITLPANAQVLLGTSGWLGIVQGKLTINLPKSISIPLAVKWSNKTDLLNAQDVRGQIGLSYDFSSLISALKNQ